MRGEESLISYKDYISDLGRGTSPLITQWTVLAQPRPAGNPDRPSAGFKSADVRMDQQFSSVRLGFSSRYSLFTLLSSITAGSELITFADFHIEICA